MIVRRESIYLDHSIGRSQAARDKRMNGYWAHLLKVELGKTFIFTYMSWRHLKSHLAKPVSPHTDSDLVWMRHT